MQKKTFDVYDNSNKAVKDAYEMLAANIRLINNDDNKLTTFTLTSYNPKEGKTAIAISLAIAMAQSGLKVLLVDADMRKPSRAKRLNKEAQLGLSDYLSEKMELREALCETNIDNLSYLSCGSEYPNVIGLLCSPRFEGLIGLVKKEYDIVLFDTPALATVMDGAFIASKTDATLLIVKIGATSLGSLERAKEQLEILNANILGAVLNKVKKRDYKTYFGAYNYFNKFNKNKDSSAKHFTIK